MKLSISLPDAMAREIKQIAEGTERSISWYLQRAWDLARTQLLRRTPEMERQRQKAMKQWHSLQGVLKKAYPDVDSVTLGHQAFLIGKKKRSS